MGNKTISVLKNIPKSLPLLLKLRVSEHPEIKLQAAKNKDGKFEFFTYKQVYEKVLALASVLKKIGLKRGSNVAMISDNRKEWMISDFAIQSIGCADVPRGCDSMSPEIRFIIDYADCEFAIFENEKQLAKVLENIAEVPKLKTVIMYDAPGEEILSKAKAANLTLYNYKDLQAQGDAAFNESVRKEIEADMELATEDDNATIIFTSGTTGTPKGVMLTHKNYMSQLEVVQQVMPGKAGEWWLSILPIWHSFERLALYVSIYLSCGTAYSKPVARTLLADLPQINPRWMCGVPRLWEALSKGVNQAMEKKGGITLKLYKFFMAVGRNYANAKDHVLCNIVSPDKRNGFADFMTGIFPFIGLFPLHLLGNLLVYRKIRSKFGSRFVFPVSGGGALQKETDEFFRAINVKMLEGYGMTETAPAMAFRDYKNPPAGCVGRPYPSLQMKIAKEENGQPVDGSSLATGEKGLILVKGPNVMKGYYKRPDLTAKIIDKDGWLNTGDLGYLSPEGILKITGRAKDTIVLLDGENIEPAGIEQALCSSDFIENAMVIGQDKKFLSSLIVPCKAAIEKYAQEHNIIYETYEKLLQNELIQKMINDIVSKLICLEKGFKACERIAKFKLISKSFEVGKELSAKLEMMRHKISEEYKSEIAAMYL